MRKTGRGTSEQVPTDLVFLSGEQYPPAKRAAFLRSYISRMANQPGAKVHADVEQAKQLLAEIESGSTSS